MPYGGSSVDLIMPGGVFPSGWVLLCGSLLRRGGDYDARLYYDLGEDYLENQYFEIPTSGKGVINELFWLPADIRRMKFSPMGTAGEFELVPLTVVKVGALERRWRMARRIIAMLFLHPRRKRKLIKLTFLRMLVDLQGAYKTAGTLRAHAAAPQYRDWIRQFDELTAADRSQINRHISRFANPPAFYLLIMPDGADSDAVQKTLDSLRDQVYRRFICEQRDMELTRLVAWLAEFNSELADSRAGEWVLLVRAGEVLAPHALYRFACEVLAKPEAVVLYSDDDVLDADGRRCDPRFKPDWSLAHFRSANFVGNAVALRGGDVAKAGGVSLGCCRHGNYDLLLRVVDAAGDEGANSVAHIPAVLLHRMHHSGNLSGAEKGLDDENAGLSQWYIGALQAHLARNRVKGEVSKTLPDCWRVRYCLPEAPPLVSIIVPTRDERALTRQCVESVLAKTTYPRFELLVVDNQSVDPEALAYLAQIAGQDGIRVLRHDYSFNYSAINNFAVQEARGEVVCLLNNDTEVISPDWLEEMVGNLMQPRVGVVGAKLYFPDGRVQHAGDVVGPGGCANHLHSFVKRNEPGYCNRAAVAQELSAVTGACLVVWKSLYGEMGGLDEKHLPVSFNDVDFCLRVREAGYRVVWTPHAELYHHESVSRGKDVSREKVRRAKREAAYMRKRWKHIMGHDPFYNPNLSYERPDFSLSKAPLVRRPWRD